MLSWFNNLFWIQQDYLWFLAGVGWLVVGTLWWQGRHAGAMPAWVPWSAGTGFAIACIQILNLVTPLADIFPYQAPSLWADMGLGAALAIHAAGWWFVGMREIRRGRTIAGLMAALLLAVAAWRYSHPMYGSVVIAVATLGAMGWWLVRKGAITGRWRIALLATGAALLLDTTGPIFSALDGSQRWWEFSIFGPWAAMAQCVAAGVALATWLHGRNAARLHQEDHRLERLFLGGAMVWLALGLVFALVVSAWARGSFQESALGRVRATAAVVPMANIQTLLDDRFVIGELEWHHFPNDSRLPVAVSDHARVHSPVVFGETSRILAANPDVRAVWVSTLRNGWLVGAAIAQRHGPAKRDHGSVTLFRLVSADDQAAWTDRDASFVGPVMLSFGESVFSRAPLLDPQGEMLGWLNLGFGVSQWLAAQAQPRALAYVVIVFGLLVGQQRLAQLLRARERDRAQAAASALAQANDLKTTFLAKVSHELRTPLQSFVGYTELMLPGANPRDRDRLLAMREHADLMGRLVNDLIDLSAAECGRFQLVERPVALADLITQAAESLRPSAETKGLTYTIELGPDVPAGVEADPQRIRQVVLNLVGNAIKYTDHGYVRVRLACTARDKKTAAIELSVADTGPGIAPEVQAGLFAAFSRLAPTARREGTGLGLAIVAAVSQAMGGDVGVRSDGHTGSTFTARWRLRVTAVPVAVAAARVPLQGKRILVADDNALVRDLFISYLTECGAVCAPAADGWEAIQRLRSESFDAVVLDLAMPRLDGLATVRLLRRAETETPWRIVGVSAHAGGAEHRDALAAGMDAFLTKPVALPDLARSLAPVAGWIPPELAFVPVRAHFEHRFRTDARIQSVAITAACSQGDWPEVARLAHHLRNSAGVVSDTRLTRECAALEAAARSGDTFAAIGAWQQCERTLAPWLAAGSEN